MSLLEDVFSLTKEEQIALLDKLEKKASVPSPIALPKEVIDTFELPPEVDIEKELATIKEIVLAEVQAITINAPKGDKGDKGDKGAVGPQGPKGIDGVAGKDGKQGVDGKDGIDGISVTDARVDFDGTLVITLSDGKEINAGDVIPNDKKELVIQSLKNGALSLIELGIEDYLSSPTPIGDVTPNTGKFTSVTTPSVTATTNNLTLSAISTGVVNVNTVNGTQFRVNDSFGGGTSAAYWNAYGATAQPRLRALSSSNAWVETSGTGSLVFATNSGVVQQVVSHTASAVNYVQVTGSSTGNQAVISVQGSDTNVPLAIAAKGTGTINLQQTTSIGRSATNWLAINGSTASGNAVQANIFGADTNVSLALQPKGTGAIDLAAGSSGVNISNGGTITSVTTVTRGSGYTARPVVAISAPTTAGGVTATATASLNLNTATLVSGGTGYTAGNVLTMSGVTGGTVTIRVDTVASGVISTFTITNFGSGTVTAIPANPASVTGGTGTGATFNAVWNCGNITVGTAGSGYIEPPTITITGAASNATAFATIGSPSIIRTHGNYTSFYASNSGSESLRLYGNDTVNGQFQQAAGPGMFILPPQSGFGAVRLGSVLGIHELWLQAGGSAIAFTTNSNGTLGQGTRQFNIAHTASAVNYMQVTGSSTGNRPVIQVVGSDTNIGVSYTAKGTGIHAFGNGNGTQFIVHSGPTSSVNRLEVTPSIAGVSPFISTSGTDTNINLNLVPKGTGTVQQNGTPLALSTHKYHAFNVGSYYYDNYNQDNYLRLFTQNATADTIRYGTVTSPEYYDYGTSTWTAWAAGQSGIQNLLDGNPGTGMEVAHANRTFRFIVNASDGYPTNTLILLQSTWSAVTYTTATVTIESSTTVGGTYTSRQVMVFSPANTGNNWGMHAYYASTLHTGNQFYRITIDLTDWVDSGIYLTYPLRNLSVYSNYSNIAGRQVPYSNSFDKTTAFIGGISTPNDANGILTVGRYSSGNTQAIIDTPSSTTAMLLRTQSFAQVRVAHTASAVNYVELSGGTTSNGVTFSAQGSDANINTFISSKGTGVTVFNTGVGEQFRVATISNAVNNLQAYGATIGNAPAIGARGTDANVDIALIPKGTGRVKFGTYTAGMLINTGYIEIVDSGGTVRKLAVVA